MATNMSHALLITLIGMSLVFVALMILWAAMAVLMRILADKPSADTESEATHLERELRRKAAIAAVVVAMARDVDTDLHEFPLPPTAFVSAWQAVMRGNITRKRGQVR